MSLNFAWSASMQESVSLAKLCVVSQLGRLSYRREGHSTLHGVPDRMIISDFHHDVQGGGGRPDAGDSETNKIMSQSPRWVIVGC